ncbi:hypothetical protein CWR48_16505 [Oceanobacillus arenosus]|uniref:Uncharacterized protein n=1 Tax=Oceanobacillus arenosus TaxID=1229153 RepID=A0A3D8PKB3_9BACI|nr:hypothetical protein CWR48_16505 [Oceanobacillus arenosus]
MKLIHNRELQMLKRSMKHFIEASLRASRWIRINDGVTGAPVIKLKYKQISSSFSTNLALSF